MTSRPKLFHRLKIFSWTLFDFANTAFYVVILTICYPLYFREHVVGDPGEGDLLWGTTFSISMIIVAIISPILGAAADQGVGKKKFLIFFTSLCIFATSLLFFVDSGMIIIGILLLILANIGFEAGLVFYDAYLPELSSDHNYGRISGYGFAMGYLGSLVTLISVYPLVKAGFIETNIFNVRFTFLLAAGYFLVFSLPLFLFVKDQQQHISFQFKFIRAGLDRVRKTFHEISMYKNVGKFLLAYFIYVDAINTVIIFSSSFARHTLKMQIDEIIIFFLLVQTAAIIGSVIFGILSDHIGQKITLNITLILWLSIVITVYFIEDKTLFYIVGFFAGISMGSSQSTSRSLMSLISPPEKKTEFFGFYSFFGKASAILGPFIFGVIASYFNQRLAITSVGIFFLIGLLLLQRVSETKFHVNPSIT